MEWCTLEFRLLQPQSDGASLRAHLLAVPERYRDQDPELAELLRAREAPTRFMYLFDAFIAIARSRRSGFDRPDALGPEQIYFWQKVCGFQLHDWEVAVIYRLDEAWFNVFVSKPKTKAKE